MSSAVAANATYSVDWQPGIAPRVNVHIDTHKWAVQQSTPTAYVTVIFDVKGLKQAQETFNFLAGLQQPRSLRQGEVYERSFRVHVKDATGIAAASVEFPNTTGKPDDSSGPSAQKGSAGTTTQSLPSQAESVVVPPPPGAILTIEQRVNRNLGDIADATSKVASYQKCAAKCRDLRKCVAYTYVGDSNGGVCWLKDRVTSPSSCANCVSGVKSVQ
jgi:hypothetical protein